VNAPVTEAHARQVGQWSGVFYRAWPTKRDYSFTFEFAGDAWKVYIDNSPDYGRRPAGSVATHRLDIGGRPHICWAAAIPTLSEAQAVAALWADSTENYIATGRFEPAAGRPKVQDRTVLNGFPAPPGRPNPAATRPTPARAGQRRRPRQSLWSRLKDQL
jgi:hypothetical protein